MGRAYLIIAVPAVVVGVFYFAIFHSMGLQVRPGPFLGALGGFAAAALIVRYFQKRKVRRSGS